MRKPKAGSATFAYHDQAKERLHAALELVRVIVPLEIHLGTKRVMLSHCLWCVTEAEASTKYGTRYRSEGSIGKKAKDLHHEHVIPRKQLVDQMLANPDRAVEIAASALGCTVTRKEHQALSSIDREHTELLGWERYRTAGILVINTETGEPAA